MYLVNLLIVDEIGSQVNIAKAKIDRVFPNGSGKARVYSMWQEKVKSIFKKIVVSFVEVRNVLPIGGFDI